MKQKIIIANWKMNMRLSQIREFFLNFDSAKCAKHGAKLVICPPFVYLHEICETLNDKSHLYVGAQDVSCNESEGGANACTSQIAPDMLSDFNCKYVIVGHCEVRNAHNISDEDVAKKAQLALKFGIKPVICIGEKVRNKNSKDFLKKQLEASTQGLSPKDILIAYEPIWSIGTGSSATCDDINEAIELFADFSFLYGGSVNQSNANAIYNLDGVDGLLIGKASLCYKELMAIIKSCD